MRLPGGWRRFNNLPDDEAKAKRARSTGGGDGGKR